MQEIETQNLASQPDKVAELPHAEHSEIKFRVMSPIGITKASHEESKKRRKAASKSRKLNRKK